MKIEALEAIQQSCDKALKNIDGVGDVTFLRETFYSLANYIKGICEAYIIEEDKK
jgi:hypothetical protein